MIFRAVIFDMDGVLVDSEPLHRQAWHQVFEQLGVPFTSSDYGRILGMTTFDIITCFFKEYAIQADPHEWSDRKESLYRSRVRNELQPIEGLLSFIRFLELRNIRMGVASSAVRKNIEAVLDCLNLQGRFHSILGIEDVQQPKPHPEIYAKSVSNFQLPAPECVVIEDSILGLQAAKEAGTFAIGITTSFPASQLTQGDRVFETFTQIGWFMEQSLDLTT